MAGAKVKTEEIFKDFKEYSVAEFFKKNKQMLGFSGPIKSMTTIVHEYVTNAIDAAEAAGILPDITVKILKEEVGTGYEIVIEDNGSGMPVKVAGKALGQLLAGTKFEKLSQSRGQQGIGAAYCTLFSQITTGKPTHVKTGTGNGKVTELTLTIDVKNNKPKIESKQEYSEDYQGTRITSKFKEVQFTKGYNGPAEYLRRTALANPHVQITFEDPEGRTTIYKRNTDEIPKIAKTIKPHPKGTTTDEIINLARRTDARKVSSMLKSEFSRMGSTSIRAIQKKVSFDLESAPRKLNWAEAEEIVLAIKELKFMAPETDAVQPIGPKQIEKSMKNIINPEYLTVSERPPKVYHEGIPFQVECGIAYGGGSGKATRNKEGEATRSLEVIRYANRVPLLFDQGGCALTKAAQSVEWRRYGIKGGIDNAPVSIFLNINSVRVPYTGAGKTAVSDEEEIIAELRYALMDAGRKIEKYLKGKARDAEMRKKKERLEKYVPITAASIATIANDNAENLKTELQKLVLKRFKELDDTGAPATVEEIIIEDDAETEPETESDEE